MAFSLIWLPRILRNAGLTVAEYPGWMSRGHGDMGSVKYVICHHSATGQKSDPKKEMEVVVYGRPDLPGPLAQLWLDRRGVFTVLAAGKGYHAGKGEGKYAAIPGNRNCIGIEAENDGVGEPWTPQQMDAYAKGVAAILKHLRLPVNACIAHKEWAPSRKIDPSFPMPEFRNRVAGFLKELP